MQVKNIDENKMIWFTLVMITDNILAYTLPDLYFHIQVLYMCAYL